MAAKKASASKTSGARKKSKRKKTGNGSGWGGPARGAHPNKPAYVFKGAGPGRGRFTVAGELRAEREARHAVEMRDLLYGFATDDGREDTIRLQAATKYLDRLEGLPVQRIISPESDPITRLTDEQLKDRFDEQQARIDTYERLKDGGGDAPNGD